MNIKHDLDQLNRQLGRMERGLVPKAASQAINRTAKSVHAVARREVAKSTGIKQKEFKQNAPEGFTLSTANRNRLQATINAAKAKAKNLIEFVRPAQRKPNYFNQRSKRGKYKAAGVKARAWGKLKTYRGSFIQRASNGKLLVLKRKSQAGPRGGTTKGLPGPSPRHTLVDDSVQLVLVRQTRERFRIELTRAINNQLRRLRR